MFNHDTLTLLQKSLPDLPAIVCEPSLRYDIDALVLISFPGLALGVVFDDETAVAMGDQVCRALAGGFAATAVSLGASPIADSTTVERIRRETTQCDALIAVGSGTINDLCKYAAYLDGKPYLVFPTAASMNGYLSMNASIAVNGYKHTFPAAMPIAVFCDLSVIASSPKRLNRSGLGDSLARSTAQFDWLLSHLVLGTPYNETPFTLLAPTEPALLENARGIAMADPTSLKQLIETLLLSGLGMTIARGSYPASQSEHMVAHTMHMLQNTALPQTFHGEEIGVTTLTIAAMQHQWLAQSGRLQFSPLTRQFPEAQIVGRFGPAVTAEAKELFAIKTRAISTAKTPDMQTIAHRLSNIMLPVKTLQAALQATDAPLTPESLGWAPQDYSTALTHARFMRERFTILDI